MNDPMHVGGSDGVAGLEHQIDRLGDLHAPVPREARLEVRARQVLHDHERAGKLVLADVEDARDVLALQANSGARLAKKTTCCALLSLLGAEELDGDLAFELHLRGREHDAHAPLTQDAVDPVAPRDDRADRKQDLRLGLFDGCFGAHRRRYFTRSTVTSSK